MTFFDTHTHLFLREFNTDRQEIIAKSIKAGVTRMMIPNIDVNSINRVKETCELFPENCFPAMGLHPSSVKEDYIAQLQKIKKEIEKNKYFAIGETGIDLYWDKTFVKEQKESFSMHIEWSLEVKLPIIIHIRNAFKETFEVLEKYKDKKLNGVFHCFSGNYNDAKRAIEQGFMLGIGGVVTYNNSEVQEIVSKIGLEHIVLETDSPYLTPVPYRGKRNESSYIPYIASKIAELKNTNIEEVAHITSNNASKLFNI